MIQRVLAILLMLNANVAFAAAKIQNEDVKSLSQITAAGGTVLNLINDSKIAVTANGINQTLNSAITSGLIGGGGAGVNLLKNGDFESTSLTGTWSTFQTTVVNQFPTTAPAACATCSITISNNTTTPLDGKSSLQMAAASAVTAGHGFISNAVTVPPVYQGQVLTIKGFNSLLTGIPNISGTSANTFQLAVYDVTNAAWIQPTGASGIGSATGPFSPGSFQIPSNSTSIRLAVFAANALASPTTILFDDLMVGPQASAVSVAMTDWKPYTAVLSGGSTGTRIVNIARYRQVGQEMELHIQVYQTSAGSTGTYTLSLPPGFQIDTALMPIGRSTYAGAFKGSGAFNFVGHAYPASSTSLGVVYQTNSGGVQNYQTTDWGTDQVGTLANANYGYSIVAKVPIVGFSSGVQQSSDYDGRPTTFTGSNASQSYTGGNPIALTSTSDRGGAWTGTEFVVQVPGDYQANGSFVSPTAANAGYFAVNNSAGGTYGFFNNVYAANGITAGSTTLPNLKVGDRISMRYPNTATLVQAFASIYRIGGNQPIQLSPSLSLRYTSTSGGTIASATASIVNFNVKIFDDRNAFDGTVFRAPVSGKYKVTTSVATAVLTLSAQQSCGAFIYKNGAAYSLLASVYGNGGSIARGVFGSDSVDLLQGETASIYAQCDVSTTVNTNPLFTHLAIERIAN